MAIVLTLLVQVAALTECAISGYGTVATVTAVTTARLAITWSCVRGVPSARPDGLGALVSGTVSRTGAVVETVVVVAGAAVLGQLDDDRAVQMSLTLAASVLVALGVAWFVRRRAVRLLGGITGDVLGAVVEITTAAASSPSPSAPASTSPRCTDRGPHRPRRPSMSDDATF